MASTNKTKNYELNQWVGTDPVLMEDFNADNAKLDAALAVLSTEGVKMAVGSYVGTGEYGSSKPNTLSFDFVPSLVIVRKYYSIPLNPTSVGAVMIRPASYIPMDMFSSGDSSSVRPLNLSWGEKSVSWWYNAGASFSSYGANWQMNIDGDIYYYFAIGK